MSSKLDFNSDFAHVLNKSEKTLTAPKEELLEPTSSRKMSENVKIHKVHKYGDVSECKLEYHEALLIMLTIAGGLGYFSFSNFYV